MYFFFRSQQGMTPLDLALEKRNTSLARLLKKKFGVISAPPSILEELADESRSTSSIIENVPNFSNKPPVVATTYSEVEAKNIRRASDQKR